MSFFKKYSYYLGSIFELLVGVKNWKTLFEIFLGKEFVGVKWLELRRNNLKVGVGSKMEAWSVKETLLDRIYTVLGAEVQPNWVVVDIGAAIGEFTIEAALNLTDGIVHAFEPNPGSINILRQNLRANKLGRVETYNLGAWNEQGEIPLHFYNDEPLQAGCSDRKPSKMKDVKVTTIPVISFREVIEEKVASKIDLLKLDCEGAEYEILLHQDPELFEQIDRIVMEYHDLADDKDHRLLIKELEKNGFQVSCYPNLVHCDLGYLYAEKSDISKLA